MKKKDTLSQKDKEDWKNFLEDTSHVPDKDQKYQIKNVNNILPKIESSYSPYEISSKRILELI